MNKNVLSIKVSGNITRINIKFPCNFRQYDECLDKHRLQTKTPYKALIKNDEEAKKQSVYMIDYSDYFCSISKTKNELIIYGSKIIDTHVLESRLEIDNKSKTYTVYKSIYDSKHDLISCGIYYKNCKCEMGNLNGVDAYRIVNEMLEKLSEVKQIEKIIDIKSINEGFIKKYR